MKIFLAILTTVLLCSSCTTYRCSGTTKTYYENGQIKSESYSNSNYMGSFLGDLIMAPFALVGCVLRPTCNCHMRWQNPPPHHCFH